MGGFRKASVRDAEVDGRRVLLRADLNVPLEEGKVADDTRIRASLPTIELLRERGASVVLVSHLGRPKGADPALSMKPVAERLGELLEAEVTLAPGVVGAEVEAAAGELEPGEVLLLENSRFEPGETENDPELAKALAALADALRQRRLRRRPPRPRQHRGRRAPAADLRRACCWSRR